LRCIGQEHGIGIRIAWRTRWTARPWAAFVAPHHHTTLEFFRCSRPFSPAAGAYETDYFKAKSDCVVNGLSDNGIEALLQALKGAPAGPDSRAFAMLTAGRSQMFASQRVPPSRTVTSKHSAFNISLVGRGRPIPPQRLTNMSKAYAAMRPHVPGACYVNLLAISICRTGRRAIGVRISLA